MTWHFSTDHAASSYGLAVLVSPDGTAYGKHDMLTLSQVDNLNGWASGVARQYVHRGKLKASKFNNQWLVRAEDAIKWPPSP